MQRLISAIFLFLTITTLSVEGRCTQTVQLHSRGACVKLVQIHVGTAVDGIFGPNTKSAVTAYQRRNSLPGDGIVGPNTWYKILVEGRCTQTVQLHSRGTCVKLVQLQVGTAIDGIFGPNTQNAVIAYQDRNGLAADGMVGPNTWRKIYELL
jgi:peptidoglycan hydrolase-like protein with peptidoglycan-binding domain